ncbi:hypothetical protein OA866_00770 [bacterium]|nr:hypothetical protein [bacterium]
MDYVEIITLNLDNIVDFIEVGSSLSFGYGNNRSLKDDQLRYDSVCKYSNRAQPTIFIQPFLWEKIGSPKLSSIFSEKPGLIRIGIDPELEPSLEHNLINQCFELNIPCSINLMKAYKFSDARLKELASDLNPKVSYVSVVDSSGCMLPSEVDELLKKLIRCFKASFGLHIHNNTGYANTISIGGLASGYCVDSTLLGRGRAGGNADTCLLVLKRALMQNTELKQIDEIVRSLLNATAPIWGDAARIHITNILLGITSLHSSRLNSDKFGSLELIPTISAMMQSAWNNDKP